MKRILSVNVLALAAIATAFLSIGSLASAANSKCKFVETSTLEQVYKGLDDKLFTANRKYTPQNVRFVTGLRAKQIVAMTNQTSGRLNGVTYSEVEATLEAFDDKTIYKADFRSSLLPSEYYTVVDAYAGDTQIGAIFEGGTTHLVAEIGDGDVMICDSKYEK